MLRDTANKDYRSKKLPWVHPDIFAQSKDLITEDFFIYFKSSHDKGFSYIAFELFDSYEGSDIEAGISQMTNSKKGANFIFSLLPYELMSSYEESYNTSAEEYLPSTLLLAKFKNVYVFDHEAKIITAHFLANIASIDHSNSINIDAKLPQVNNISSNFTDNSYIDSIIDIKKSIAAGEYYQTNLTRKYFGKFSSTPTFEDCLSSFIKLTNSSPANFSCFVKMEDRYILCNSPELFLRLNDSVVESKPIKGTEPRSPFILDYFRKKSLANSDKNKSENLMIVDLVRNDLSYVCDPGSIRVDDLFELSTYKSYHHLSSKITSKLSKDKNICDLIKSSFPPGSMTGAPKIAAVNAANEYEKIRRGIYSGSIGLINNDREAILNVVIRTIVIENDNFEFQVGGAITHDSNPNDELNEIFTKAKSICEILSIKSLKNVG